MPHISPHAVVEDGARLAADVRVGPFTYVGPQVTVGAGCVIENNATLTGNTTLGRRNHVFPMAVIGPAADGDDGGACVVGEGNAIREHVTIYGGAAQPTRIGSDNLLMIGCQVGGGASVGDHGLFANFTQIGAGARVEDYIRTSGFSVVAPDVTVGAYTFTLGYAEVDRDAPPYAMVQGSPFRVRGVNTHNLQRCGFDDGDIRALKDAFRELFNGATGCLDGEALRRLLAKKALNRHVRRLADALSRRGEPPARGGADG